mgnify:CR=1 FL=1
MTVARKEKKGERWFLGAITDENARDTQVKLDFLSPNKKYKAVIYQDGKDADWKNNPKNYRTRCSVFVKYKNINSITTLGIFLKLFIGIKS